MKFLVLSDIHGSAESLEKALASFEKDCDAIILLGDYLNHGPRNPLHQGWDTKRTAELLNSRKEKLICVRGNCDSEVDEMMLTFSCLNAYTTIVLSSHTHVTLMEEENGLFYFNPGSISLPKCEDGKTCGILEVGGDSVKVSLHSIDGKLIREMKV